MIRFEGVTKRYPGAPQAVLSDFCLEVTEGTVCALLGRSGAGKSTALRLVNRLLDPDEGRILLAGADVRSLDLFELRRSIGYVLQRVGLLPHLTVGENVGLVPRISGWKDPQIRARVDELLTLVHLPPEVYRDRAPSELSGGQQQRVGFARALAAYPRVLLMDEPFGALDPVTRADLREELVALRRLTGTTTLIVTHDVMEALQVADEIVVLDEGKIVQRATPRELVSHPATDFVARLIEAPRRDTSLFAELGGKR
jgi:osmoprotectant transport system ATP-binding protein